MPRQIPDHPLGSAIADGDLLLLRRVSDGVDVKAPGSLLLRASQLAANGGTVPETDKTNSFSADQALGGNRITGLGAPVAADDAARKGDADAVQDDLDAHAADSANPHGVTAAQVGLGNVPNVDATDMATWDQKGATSGQVPTWDGAAWSPADVPSGSTLTASEVKTLYESNADTNAYTDSEKTKLAGIETGATADQVWGEIGGTLSSQTDLQSALATKEDTANKGVANGYASLDAGAKVPSIQLPAIAITNTFVVASGAEMLALGAQTGDVAVRTDESRSYILQGSDPSLIGDWQELQAPSGGVSSVTGAAPITSTGGAAPQIGITAATPSARGSMSAADKTKLDGIEGGATADQTPAEIKTAYESNADTNAFTDSDKTKLDGIEDGATASAGDVTGPASSSDNALVRFDGTTGKVIQGSPVTVGDSGEMAGHSQSLDLLTADFTLAASQNGKNLDCAKAGAFTVTVPDNATVALPVGYTVAIVQAGAGTVTVTPAGGVTIRSAGSLTDLAGQWSAATLYKRATDEWVLLGDLA